MKITELGTILPFILVFVATEAYTVPQRRSHILHAPAIAANAAPPE